MQGLVQVGLINPGSAAGSRQGLYWGGYLPIKLNASGVLPLIFAGVLGREGWFG